MGWGGVGVGMMAQHGRQYKSDVHDRTSLTLRVWVGWGGVGMMAQHGRQYKNHVHEQTSLTL